MNKTTPQTSHEVVGVITFSSFSKVTMAMSFTYLVSAFLDMHQSYMQKIVFFSCATWKSILDYYITQWLSWLRVGNNNALIPFLT